MCLGIPGKVEEIFDENGLKMGNINYGGIINKVCLEYVPEIKIGQYTVVHAGFGISIINEEEAMKSYEAWEELAELAAKDGVDLYGNPLEESESLDK